MTWHNILLSTILDLSQESVDQEYHKDYAEHDKSAIFDEVILSLGRLIGAGLSWKLMALHA